MFIRLTVVLALMMLLSTFAFSEPNYEGIQRDIDRLVEAASKLKAAWPWQSAIPEVAMVARHGRRAAPCLVRLLKCESFTQEEPCDLHVDQQVELALCEIYKMSPESGKTVFGVRSFDTENRTVKGFWQKKVNDSLEAQPSN